MGYHTSGIYFSSSERWILNSEKRFLLTGPAVNMLVNEIYTLRVRYHFLLVSLSAVTNGYLWRSQQSTVTSSAEYAQGDRETESMCENRRFYHGSVCRVRNKIIYVGILSWRTVYVLTRVIWVFLSHFSATRVINTKRTLSRGHKQFATRVHTLFFINSYNSWRYYDVCARSNIKVRHG